MAKTIVMGTLHLACGHTITPPQPQNPNEQPSITLETIDDPDDNHPTLYPCPVCHEYREARHDK